MHRQQMLTSSRRPRKTGPGKTKLLPSLASASSDPDRLISESIHHGLDSRPFHDPCAKKSKVVWLDEEKKRQGAAKLHAQHGTIQLHIHLQVKC